MELMISTDSLKILRGTFCDFHVKYFHFPVISNDCGDQAIFPRNSISFPQFNNSLEKI